MKSLATYYFRKIESEYSEWKSSVNTSGVPGRLVLREFDPKIVTSILDIINSSSLPLAPVGSEQGFIVAIEDHDHYADINVEKQSFADLTHERNREGSFFCLMFIAETKPTHDQVTRIDQGVVFELSETAKWIEISKNLHPNGQSFLEDHINDLALFVSELTNSNWNNRPFIETDKINTFIENVIIDTIKDGLFWDALGKNFVHLGGINRLDECRPLQNAGNNYRRIFRKLISSTLFVDIDFWRAIYRNKEIDNSEIKENLLLITSNEPLHSDFCNAISEYFDSYFSNANNMDQLKKQIQSDFDYLAPFPSVLQPKKTTTAFKLGEQTISFLSDNDIDINDNFLETLTRVDDKSNKPDKNDLRKFYFSYSKEISEDPKLDKAWLKEISTSKITECNDLIEGLMKVLSKTVFLDIIGEDKIQLRLAKDRTKKSLLKKNRTALKFIFNEYRDLSDFWSLFGDNFELDLPKCFSEEELFSSKEPKDNRSGKVANELYFRILRYSDDPNSPSQTWDLKWSFNPNGFESVKYVDFEKISGRKGFYHKHEISVDPLFIKRSECSPTINNSQMFLAISPKMKRGAVVKKLDKEDNKITQLLSQLYQYNHLSKDEHDKFVSTYEDLVISWKNAVEVTLLSPLCVELSDFEIKFTEFTDLLLSKITSGEVFRELLYEFITAHTLFIGDNSEYAVFLPWSPYSLLMSAKKNKIYRDLAASFRNMNLVVGNQDDGVLSKLFSQLNESYGKGLFLRKDSSSQWNDLVCTQSKFGYYEYSSLANSKNAINEREIRSVLKGTISKFLETFPNERHHLQVMCDGLLSYEHILTVYDEALKLSEDQEDQISISLTFTCKERPLLDVIYQRICESFDASKIDNSINVRIISSLNEVTDGEIDLLFSFDPLFTTNVQSQDAPECVISDSDSSFWEYSATRKVPSDPISKKSAFSLNNHILDSTAFMFHKAFMLSSGNIGTTSFCREVAQTGLKDEINKGLTKSNWLVIYDYLLCKETLMLSENMTNPMEHGKRRVLRYVQGEGLKRSLAIVTEKETHYITTNLNRNLRNWRFVHPEEIDNLVNKIFNLSNSFSSDVLLKSVGNGSFSHDLVGTAGSAVLIESMFEAKDKVAPIFWVHLDDYIGWFKSSIEDDALKSIGRSINYVSDLFGIFISENSDGQVTLNLIVCESKLTNGSAIEQSVKSCKQLKSTSELVQGMLETANAFDFAYWLNKFLEFVIGNFKFIPNKFDFTKLLNLEKNSFNIDLYGLSILFHYDNESIKSDAYTIWNGDDDCKHLSQVKLSLNDTKKVFQHMLDSSNELNMDLAFEPIPLKLNRDTLIDKSQIVVEIPQPSDTTTTETDEDQSLNQYEEVSPASSSQETSPQTKKTDTVEPSPIITVTTSQPADGAVVKLVDKCIEYLETNTTKSQDDKVDIDAIKSGVRKIFGHSNLPSEFSDSIITPNSIVIKIQGDVNLKENKIIGLRGTFLSVVGLSLRQVYPEPGMMVLVFDRDKRQTVFFGELLKKTYSERFSTLEKGYNNKILIGQNEFGEDCSFFKLDGASPHALIGGQTKSGKSILMNNMITDLMMSNTPENLKLRLFDPKQVEFSLYSGSPHLAHPVVLDKDTAVKRLEELETLMNERYVTLKDIGIKDFEAYNTKYPDKRMSREVVFFDELADWILDAEFKKNAKDIIVRLSSKGRAAGIHLVLATQRPSNDVVFPLLRANLDTKIALKVDRDLNSEIILGESGAENLLGYGHGIVKSEGQTLHIQVGFTEPHIFDELIKIIINYWKKGHN